jgi:hypothetical protein
MADLRNSSGDGRMEAREKGVEMENGRERERERRVSEGKLYRKIEKGKIQR